MKIISPSVLACDFLNIEEEISRFKGIDDLWLHLDIMDGHFVPNLTFGHPVVNKLSKMTDIPLDAHLMVTNPEFYIDTMKDYGIHNFTFHLESVDNSLELVKKAKKHFKSVGISIKPKTEVSDLGDDILKEVDLVLVMSVEPGFGGQSFIESSYEKVTKLKERITSLGTQCMIQIDGGVSDKNSKKLFDCGCDNLVAGSYVFKAPERNYSVHVEKLRE
jgi:ribulose-phosphate 3-epimerase